MKIRRIRSALIGKGFERSEGGSHERYSMRVDGKVAVVTVMKHFRIISIVHTHTKIITIT